MRRRDAAIACARDVEVQQVEEARARVEKKRKRRVTRIVGVLFSVQSLEADNAKICEPDFSPAVERHDPVFPPDFRVHMRYRDGKRVYKRCGGIERGSTSKKEGEG